MKSYLHNTLGFLVLFLMLQNSAVAQNAVEPSVEAILDRDSILIGEQLTLDLVVEAAAEDSILFPLLGEDLYGLEVVNQSEVDTNFVKDRVELVKSLALTQFDSGAYLLKPLRFEINGQPYFTKVHYVTVSNVAVDTLQQAAYDIKEIRELPYTFMEILPWILLILAFVIFGYLLYRYWLKRKKSSPEYVDPASLRSPYEKAMDRFKDMDGKKLWQNDKLKEYYVELTGVVRHYLEEEHEINALEYTSDEILEKTKKLDMSKSNFQKLKDMLRDADLVKFAKFKPGPGDNEKYRRYAEEIIEDLKPAMQEEHHE